MTGAAGWVVAGWPGLVVVVFGVVLEDLLGLDEDPPDGDVGCVGDVGTSATL